MEPALKTRLIGAFVLIAIAVIVVPMFFPGQSPETDNGKTVSLALPVSPDQELTTRTMSVAPPATSATVAGAASTGAASTDSNTLATVNLPSRVPRDVHPENDAAPADKATPEAKTTPKGNTTEQVQSKASNASVAVAGPQPEKPKVSRTSAKPSGNANAPGQAADGVYEVNLGAYADAANAGALRRRVRKLGYAAHGEQTTASGKTVTRVTAGPFATRAAAEAARLRLKASIPSAPARLVAVTRDQHGDTPANAASTHKAGGWAVQIGAYSKKADAQAQAAKLRAAGFDGYVDDVRSAGRTLWRARAGPRTQRADAVTLRDAIKSRLGQSGVVVTVP
ncbi:SPOR domain-containing protein [Oleiagrimonas sp.]|jgi:DedD protein|uniref:SPOR domain-containing protein n=1 Tax=Oleiagrimonas sp. TaxID=2010330 RepID=UPI0026302573|nr:SPOR domain-containing protein [Oleiagrimonas sp.]MDA3912685.1 SPOR domain-containing protein [Oleiagrimonas sp.]